MGDDDNLRELWSEDELDTALSRLNSTVRTDAHALARARAELMAAAGGPEQGEKMTTTKKRRWVRWTVPAAAVAAVVAGLLVAQTVSFNGKPPAASAAAAELNAAADRVGATDPPVGPGQYRYVVTHAWYMSGMRMTDGSDYFAYLAESVKETWIPADYRQEWLLRSRDTGNRHWIVGTREQALAAGYPVDEQLIPDREERAPCGDYGAASEGRQPCSREGAWQIPTPEFLAGLPKDPRQLYERLLADTAGRGKGPDEVVLVYVGDVLRSGTVPADIRANLYRALAMVPSLKITDRAANLDGKIGVAYSVGEGEGRKEIIIDPATGHFIGERETAGTDMDKVHPGTVISFTSVQTTIVNQLGTTPTK